LAPWPRPEALARIALATAALLATPAHADDLGKLLADSGIETRRIQVPAPERELARLPATEQARATGLLLPVEHGLTPADRDRLLDAIFDYAIG